LLYFADPNLAIRYTGTDTVDRGVIGLSKIAPLRTEVLADVLASGQRFAIYGYPGVLGWLVPELAARKVRTYVAGEFDGRLLLIARPDATAASTRYGSVNDERQQVIHLRAELAQTKHLRLPDETSKTTGSRQALSPLILLWKHVSSRLSGSRGEYE
jgi:hypothetical protein